MGNSPRIGRIEGQYSTFRACTQEWGNGRKYSGKTSEARSEVAGSVLDRVLRKRDYHGLFDFFAGEGVAFFPACG